MALTKVQRLACIGATSAMRTAPTAGLEAILNLLPLDIFTKTSAAISALRISQSANWKSNATGHSTILQEFFGYVPTTDYITPYLDFNMPCTAAYPSREEWKNGNI